MRLTLTISSEKWYAIYVYVFVHWVDVYYDDHIVGMPFNLSTT